MSMIRLDPDQMEATAGAVSQHASEVQAAVADLETACAAQVPAALAGWLADELRDLRTISQAACLVYLLASMDTLLRVEQLRTDQSLVTALPALGTPTGTFAEPPLIGGLALGAVSTDPTSPGAGAGGFVLGAVGPAPYVPSAGDMPGFMLGLPGPTIAIGAPYLGGGGASSAFGFDMQGYQSGNTWMLSTPGRTYVGAGLYHGSGSTGSFHDVLPDPDQDY